MSDLIKKSDAIKALYKYNFVSKNVIEREINAIPSADRPAGWIPVSEKPKEDGYYLVTWEDEDGRCTLCDYYRVQFGFGKYVKAWMPLPEPYREDGEA